MRRNRQFDLGRLLGRSGAPFTFTLIGLTTVGFLALWLGSGGPEGQTPMVRALSFDPSSWSARPWSLVTYVFANPGVGAFLCVLIELFFFATNLEQAWGTRRFAILYIGLTALSALLFWAGCRLTETDRTLTTGLLPAAACVVAWATRNPGATILLYFVLPIRAAWVGWAVAILTVIWFTFGAPILAPFVAAPLALSYLYAGRRLGLHTAGLGRPQPRGRERDYEGLNWEKRRQAEEERRRLKELFERSWREDEPEGR